MALFPADGSVPSWQLSLQAYQTCVYLLQVKQDEKFDNLDGRQQGREVDSNPMQREIEGATTFNR